MLFEPGPLTLLPEDAFPRPGPRGVLGGLAAREASELGATARELEVRAGTLAPAIAGAPDLAAGLDLAAAVAEHDRQSRVSDSTIGAVAAGAGALEGDLAGLTSELARELSDAAAPTEPSPPEDAENEDWKDPEYRQIITEWYQKYLGREPEDGILDEYYNNRARLVDVLAGILDSDEYRARQQQGILDGLLAELPQLQGVITEGGGGGGAGGRRPGRGGGAYEGRGEPDIDAAQARLEEFSRRYGASVESDDARKLAEKRRGYEQEGRDPSEADREFEEQYQRRGA